MQMTLEHSNPPTQHLSPIRSQIPREMHWPVQASLGRRLARFIVFLGMAIFLIFGLLPGLTSSVPILDKMSQYLDDNGIDPTRYYYTDVEQVKEAELYLRSVLGKEIDN